MVYRELTDYIQTTRGKGYSDEQIKQTLLQRGWALTDVMGAFEAITVPRFQPLSQEEKKTREEKWVEEKESQDLGAKIARGFSSIEAWMDCIASPEKTLAEAKYFASYKRAALSLAFPYLIVAIVAALGYLLAAQQLARQLPENIYSTIYAMGAVLVVGLTAAGILLSVLQAVVANFLVWIFAKLLGGHASFKQQLLLSSVAFGAGFLISIAAGALLVASTYIPAAEAVPVFYLQEYPVPVFTVVAAAVAALLLLYSLWIHIVALRVAHEFSTLKALASVIALLACVAAVATVIGYANWQQELLNNGGGEAIVE